MAAGASNKITRFPWDALGEQFHCVSNQAILLKSTGF